MLTRKMIQTITYNLGLIFTLIILKTFSSFMIIKFVALCKRLR